MVPSQVLSALYPNLVNTSRLSGTTGILDYGSPIVEMGLPWGKDAKKNVENSWFPVRNIVWKWWVLYISVSFQEGISHAR